jgi:hypothetical protein
LLRRSLTSPQNAATLVQAERKSKIYFGFVWRRSLTSPQNAATLVQAERKSKIYFGFVEVQPLPQHRKEDEKRKNCGFIF